jgi:integrase/recombinase XerD
MVTLRLPFVVLDRDRHGNVRYYFRRKGFRKIRLRGVLGSKEFMDAYNDALTNHAGTIRREHKDPNSFEFLCNLYFKSATFGNLSASTQSWRYRELQQICKQHGTKPFAR